MGSGKHGQPKHRQWGHGRQAASNVGSMSSEQRDHDGWRALVTENEVVAVAALGSKHGQ